jgi:hypothetical protein
MLSVSFLGVKMIPVRQDSIRFEGFSERVLVDFYKERNTLNYTPFSTLFA